MPPQKTISHPVTVEGRGLFGGRCCRLRFEPAECGSGIAFVRDDLPAAPRIDATIANVAPRPRRTSLADGEAVVETVEHVLAAAAGLGIDNLTLHLDADETPATDASAAPFVRALQEAGLREQDAERNVFVIDEPLAVGEGDATIAALPGPPDALEILYELAYGAGGPARQVVTFRLGVDDFAAQIAPARTFALKAEAEALRAAGVAAHLTARDVVVLDTDGACIDNELRFDDEQARHKVCDLIGDLALLRRPLAGRIVACRSGHALNHTLVRRLADRIARQEQARALAGEPLMDIRHIMRLLPHRYPFLMVDRIIEIDGDSRIVGVKNVSINEPFFQGHYPGEPIMPGVLVLEALAQVSGLLLSRRLEHTGKVAVLLSMDKVKMRKPVRPGDRLLLEARRIHVRSRTGHCRCRALLGEDVAAEAEIKFMLVDAEQA